MHRVGLPFLPDVCHTVLQGQVRESRIKQKPSGSITYSFCHPFMSLGDSEWPQREEWLFWKHLAESNGHQGQEAPLADQGPLREAVPLHQLLAGQWGLQGAHTEILQLQWDPEGLWPRHQDALWEPSVWPGAQGVRWVSKARYVQSHSWLLSR